MDKLSEHYGLLLGLDDSWEASDVELDLEGQRVEIRLTHRGGPVTCPECQKSCSIADHAPERTWRHLDTMQFETVLRQHAPSELFAVRREDDRRAVGGQAFAVHAAVRGVCRAGVAGGQ